MRLWVINLKEKKKKQRKTYKNTLLPDLNFKTLLRKKETYQLS